MARDKTWAKTFVELYDAGAAPDDYRIRLGLSFDELCKESLKIQEYRNLSEGIVKQVKRSQKEVEFASAFVALVNKGAGLRAYRSIGILSREDFNLHLARLSEYREWINGGYTKPLLTFITHSYNFEYLCGSKPKHSDKLCSVIVIGTTIPSRLPNLIKVISKIDECLTSAFGTKVISIDDFGEGVSSELVEYATRHSWVIISAKRRGMARSQRDALSLITSPWVLYNEDDAAVEKLPSEDEFRNILETDRNGRRCGVLSLMAGGYNIDAYRDRVNWELRNADSYIKINSEDVMWVRDDSLRNNWFIEFPISIMRTHLMKQCSDYVFNRNYHIQIEHGFTTAWFEQGLDREFFKASYMKNPAHIKPLCEYSYGDITSVFINRPLIHMRLLSSFTIDRGHNFSETI